MKCFDEEGQAWLVDSTYDDCASGIYLGPPDLSDMELDPLTLLKLREKLVDAFLYNAETILGQRDLLMSIFNELNLTKRQLQRLVGIYQQDFYGDG